MWRRERTGLAELAGERLAELAGERLAGAVDGMVLGWRSGAGVASRGWGRWMGRAGGSGVTRRV